jgi:thiol-disulfide isomerase/thioredoxin
MSLFTAQQVHLGPVTLQTPVFLVLVAAIAGGVMVYFKYRGDKARRRLFFDRLSTAAMVGLLGWKLFPLVYSFSDVITNPMTLLYTPGGTPGVLFGFVLGLLYFGWKIFKGKKKRTPEGSLLSPLLVFGVSFIGLSAVLLTSSSALRAEQAAKPAVQFEATTTDGKEISLDDLKGKTVILNFWATWCPPCRAELPTLIAFNKELAGADAVLIGVAVGPSQTPDVVKPFMEEAGINYPVILDPNRRIASGYAVRTLPTSVVISADGKITESRAGAVDRYWLRSLIPGT